MPDQFERHGRDDGWSARPARSQQRAGAAASDPDPVKRAPGRKDPDLCKAAHWKGPHQPVIRLISWLPADRGCQWKLMYDPRLHEDAPRWCCHHHEECAGCGKTLRRVVHYWDCPDWRPLTGQELVALQPQRTARAAARERDEARRPRKPAVTGPQGYRRKRPG